MTTHAKKAATKPRANPIANESESDKSARLQREKDDAIEEYEQDPEGANKASIEQSYNDMIEARGVTVDQNSAYGTPGEPPEVTVDDLTPSEADEDEANPRGRKAISDRSTNPKDADADVTVDPADGSKRTKDGVK